MARLEIWGEDGRREILELGDAPITIGRSAQYCEHAVSDDAVSRLHVKFVPQGPWWSIEDLGSKNGTRVDGQSLERAQQLRNGAEILIGNTRLVFLQPDFDFSSTTAKVPGVPKIRDRQREVLKELCRRPLTSHEPVKPVATRKEMAAALFVGEPAVQAQLLNLYDLFGIPDDGSNRRELLAAKVIKLGVIRRSDYEGEGDTRDS